MADARALIHGMLQVDPTQRLSIESILTHPWFKTTIIDKMPEQHGDAVSPGLTPHFDEPFARQGSTHLQIPSRGPSPLHQERVAPISEELDHLETSHLDSEHGKADTISTSATTAAVGARDEIHRVHSGEFSQTEKDLEMLHSNESQSTIRRIASESPNPVKSRVAVKSGLEGPKESDEDALDEHEDHSTPLLVAQHSRTPSRTKRRSVSSTLSLERRHSHHSTSGQWTTWPPEDYMLKLNATQAEPFSTPSEKYLLDQLESIGFNVGQITHSVHNNACDSSAAAWWMLRAKQAERGETDEVVNARQAAAQRKSERAAAYAREERKRSQKDRNLELKPANVKFIDQPTFSKTPESPTIELGPPVETPAPLSRSPEPLTPNDVGVVPQPNMLHPHSVPMPQIEQIRSAEPLTVDPSTAESSPSKDQRPTKARSPSMSMLQRATSVLVSGSWKNDEKAIVDDEEKDKRSTSPTKLIKPAPKGKIVKSESERSLAHSVESSSMEAGPSRRMSTPLAATADESPRPGPTDSPAGSSRKRDAFWSWSSFKYMFNDQRRRRSRDDSTPSKDHKVGPAVVLSRGISGRGPHVNRVAQPHPIRRSSSDGRPVFSRRSSSVNSRRSSFNSGLVHDSSHDALPTLALGRRASGRSHGSQTPTSEREFNPLSRPTSLHERDSHMRPSRRSSQNLRSPSMQSDGSVRALRYPTPASPLHNYQRRAPKGTDSRRVRHIRVIPEGHIVKSDSVASSIRSNASSRASSRERAAREDSDYDTGREDASIRSRRRPDLGSLAQQIHRKNSPLTLPALSHRPHSLKPPEPKPKAPLRDVFQGKEEEWVSDDEDIYSGGLGQKGQQSHVETAKPWEPNARAAFSPRDRDARHQGRKHGSKGSNRSRRGSSDEEDGKKISVSHGARVKGDDKATVGVESGVSGAGRRRGIPSGRGTAPVIEEEEEEEE
jgi:hypothetical protein